MLNEHEFSTGRRTPVFLYCNYNHIFCVAFCFFRTIRSRTSLTKVACLGQIFGARIPRSKMGWLEVLGGRGLRETCSALFFIFDVAADGPSLVEFSLNNLGRIFFFF